MITDAINQALERAKKQVDRNNDYTKLKGNRHQSHNDFSEGIVAGLLEARDILLKHQRPREGSGVTMNCPAGDYRSIETRVQTVGIGKEQADFIHRINKGGGNFCASICVPVWGPTGEIVHRYVAIVYQSVNEIAVA